MADDAPADIAEETDAPRHAAPSRLQRAAKWYSHVSDILTPQRIGLLLGAALLAVVGIFGGWDAAGEAVEKPVARVGDVVTADPFEFTVSRARFFDELAPPFYREEGYRYLVVSVDVTNTAPEYVDSFVLAGSATLDADGLRTIDLATGPKVLEPRVVRTADSLSERTFQPGLTNNVVLAWQQDIGEAIPDEVTVTFSQHTWRRSTMDESLGWRDPVPAARVTLPLEPLPDE